MSSQVAFYKRCGLKIAIIVGVLYSLGVPATENWKTFCLAGLSSLLIFSPLKTSELKKFAVITWCISASLICFRLVYPIVKFEEGHQLFIPTQGAHYKDWLPPDIYNEYIGRFEPEYPADTNCDPNKPGCWTQMGTSSNKFAFSADSFMTGGKYSRSRTSVDFQGIDELRIGNINGFDPFTNYYDGVSNLSRSRMPYYVMFEFPANAVGTNICWKGLAFVQSKEEVRKLSNPSDPRQCLRIDQKTEDLKLWFADIERNEVSKLQVTITPPWHSSFGLLIDRMVSCAFIAWLLYQMLKKSNVSGFLGFALVCLSILKLNSGLIISNPIYPERAGGNDPLTYAAYAYQMLTYLRNLNFIEFFRGVESTFYFMPGARYYIAFSSLVFGDSLQPFYFPLILLSTIIFHLLRLVTNSYLAFICSIFFVVGTQFSHQLYFSFNFFAPLFTDGFNEGICFFLTILGLLLIIRETENKGSNLMPGLFILSTSILFRPNHVLGVFFIFFVCFIYTYKLKGKLSKEVLIPFTIGAFPAFFCVTHNYIYGNQFIILTSASQIPENLKVQPTLYLSLISQSLTHQGLDPEKVNLVTSHLSILFSNTFRIVTFASSIFLLFQAILFGRLSNLFFTGYGLAILMPFFFYLNSDRHQSVGWALLFIANFSIFCHLILQSKIIKISTKRLSTLTMKILRSRKRNEYQDIEKLSDRTF